MKLAFDRENGLVIIPTRATGPHGDATIRLALDTGATTTMLGPDLIALVGIEVASSAERVRMTTGSGIEFVARVSLDRLEALGVSRERFPVLVHALPPSATVDGVLGLDFLRERVLVVDFRAGQVSLS